MNWYRKAQLEYPLEDPPMYGHTDYKSHGGRIVQMSPAEYLKKTNRPLEIDEGSQDNIEDLKAMILNNNKIDPPILYLENNVVVDHDGRHRAHAAIQLGITSIPVLIIGK